MLCHLHCWKVEDDCVGNTRDIKDFESKKGFRELDSKYKEVLGGHFGHVISLPFFFSWMHKTWCIVKSVLVSQKSSKWLHAEVIWKHHILV